MTMNKHNIRASYMDLAHKNRRIDAWDRFIALMKTKGYRGKPLDDRSHEGTVTCIKTWLELSGIQYTQTGNLFMFSVNDTAVAIDVVETRGSQSKIRETVLAQGGEYYRVRELYEFFAHYDNLLL